MNWRFSVPFGLLLFCWITAHGKISLVDGPTVHVYGFPFFWHKASGSISMARDINLYAMIGDVMIYIGVTMLVTKIPVVQIWLLLLPTLAIALLWTLAFISVGILSMRFWTGATIGSIVSPGTLQSYSIHFGQKFPT